MFDRELGAPEQLIDEVRHRHAKDSCAAVIDDDRDVQGRGGGFDLDDLPDVAAFTEDEISGGEIGDGRFFPIDRGDVHRPDVRNGRTAALRGGFGRQRDDGGEADAERARN